MSPEEKTRQSLMQKAEQKSFWMTERIIFLSTVASFFLFAICLYFTEMNNPAIKYKSFLDYLFNSVSVGTLTGLFRGDSGLYTFWGQFVLFLDMAMNGIIVSILAVLIILFVRFGFAPKESLESQLDKIGAESTKIVKFILVDFGILLLIGTLLFMVTGAKSLWEAIFNSSSHILNDGVTAFPNNMIPYRENVGMILSGSFLITVGGWGIAIRGVFYRWVLNLFGLKKLAKRIPEQVLAPKHFMIAVITITLFLQAFGAIALYSFDGSNQQTLGALSSESMKWLNAHYMSVSARTAGFTTIPDLSLMNDKSNFIFMGLMTIGASSGSFAGGIMKLTAFMYIFLYLFSHFVGSHKIRSPKNYIVLSEKTKVEANLRLMGFSFITIVIVILMFFSQPDIKGIWLLFEAISGVTNTGLTMGATPLLNAFEMILVIILMTIGKVGFISATISFFPKLQSLLEASEHSEDEFPVD